MQATLKRIRALRGVLRQNDPDIVISFLTKINVITILAAMGLPFPVIISERNNPRTQGGSRLWASGWLALSRRAKGIVLQTEAIRQRYPAAIAARAIVIPNPVEIPAFERSSGPGKVVVGVGRLERQKGFDLLIKAFQMIVDRHPDWRLVIWGEGSQREVLEELVRRAGLENRIAFPGVSTRPVSWLEQADLFAMSSRHEGFGNVLAEAMLAGLPVISFDCDFGPRDIVQHGIDGLLVAPDNPDELAAALDRMMAEPDLRAKLAGQAAINARRFNRNDIVAQWDAVVSTCSRQSGADVPDTTLVANEQVAR